MVRVGGIRWQAIPLMVVLGGCNVGSITMEMGEPLEGGDAGVAVSDAAAAPSGKAFFDERVMPLLESQCVACHAPGRTGPAFLAADPDVYTTVMGWPALVNVSDPGSSRLLTKGVHSGPAWNGDQAAVIREWLGVEAMARADVDGGAAEVEYRTAAIEPVDGFNPIALADLGMDGASITFSAERVGDGLYLSNLQVAAGRSGAHLVHPTVIIWEGGTPYPDPVDRLAGVEVMVPPYGTAEIGGGSFVIVDFPEGALLSFSFDFAGPMEGTAGADGGVGDGGVGSTGGCTSVPSFTTNAQPQFTAYCVRCHGGGDAMAAAAVDMGSMTDTSADAQQRSCNEILTRINRADPGSSNVFRNPDPASGISHPFKFDSSSDANAFRSAVLLWLATEAR